MNSCNFVGRLVRDPEMKTTQSGHSLAKFTIAVDRDYKNDQGKYETDFISCIAWRGTAEFVEKWFKKGKPIAVTGSLQIRKYTGNDGVDRWAAEIQVEKARFVPESRKQDSAPEYEPEPEPEPQLEPENTDTAADDTKLPFDM